MGFLQRLLAAWDVVSAKTANAPAQSADPMPFYFGTYGTNLPSINPRLNFQKLREFSRNPVVRRAVSYITNSIAALDWDVVPANGAKWTAAQRRKVAQLKNVFYRPNNEEGWNAFITQLIVDMLVIGHFACEVKSWDGNPDRPFLLYPIDASSLQLYTEWDGKTSSPRYAQFSPRGQHIDFTTTQMWYVRYMPTTETPWSVSPTEVAANHIQYLLDAESYASRTASNAVPKKGLFLGQDVTEPQVREFREYFKNEILGRGLMPIVGGSSDAKGIDLGVSGDDALFLGWQDKVVATIASAFNLDHMKFNLTGAAGITRSNGENLDDVSTDSAIRPLAKHLEDSITSFFMFFFGLANVAEFKFRFTTTFTDRKALAVIHQMNLQDDKITLDEARTEEGLAPLPNGMGAVTLSVYRAKYAQPVMSGTGTNGSNAPKDGADDINGNGGNNGTSGATTAKPAAPNASGEKSLAVNL